MPVYTITTPQGQRLVSAHSKKAAIDFVVGETAQAETASPSGISDAIRKGIMMEFAPDREVAVDAGQTDVEDHIRAMDQEMEGKLG